MAVTPKRLGEMLLDAGLLDRARLDVALLTQKSTGERLGRVLVRTGVLPEAMVARFLGQQMGLRSVDADTVRVPPLVLEQVPAGVARKLVILPMGVMTDAGQPLLFYATSDPQNASANATLESVVGMPCRPVMAGEDALRRALERHYTDADATAVGPPPSMPPPSAPPPASVQPVVPAAAGPLPFRLPGAPDAPLAPPAPMAPRAPAAPAPRFALPTAPPGTAPPARTGLTPAAGTPGPLAGRTGLTPAAGTPAPRPGHAGVAAGAATQPPGWQSLLAPGASAAQAMPAARPSGPLELTDAAGGDAPELVSAHEFIADANAVAIGLTEVDPAEPEPPPPAAVPAPRAQGTLPLDSAALSEPGGDFSADLIEHGVNAASATLWGGTTGEGGLEANFDADGGGQLELASAHEFLDAAAEEARRAAASPADEAPLELDTGPGWGATPAPSVPVAAPAPRAAVPPTPPPPPPPPVVRAAPPPAVAPPAPAAGHVLRVDPSVLEPEFTPMPARPPQARPAVAASTPPLDVVPVVPVSPAVRPAVAPAFDLQLPVVPAAPAAAPERAAPPVPVAPPATAPAFDLQLTPVPHAPPPPVAAPAFDQQLTPAPHVPPVRPAPAATVEEDLPLVDEVAPTPSVPFELPTREMPTPSFEVQLTPVPSAATSGAGEVAIEIASPVTPPPGEQSDVDLSVEVSDAPPSDGGAGDELDVSMDEAQAGPAVPAPTVDMLRALILQGLVEDALVETFISKGLVSRAEVERLRSLRK